MTKIDDLKAAFAKLPERITLNDISRSTGRTLHSVRNWAYDDQQFPEFPPALSPPGPRGVKYRDRDAVLEWLLRQAFITDDNAAGPQAIAERARRARPRKVKMTTRELGGVLGVTVRAVNYYAKQYSAEKTDDPFPEPDENGEREWQAVRTWLLRHASSERQPSNPPTKTRDERGLTAREQEVLALVQAADAEGTPVTPAWLTQELQLRSTDSARRLLRAVEPHRTKLRGRARPTALARAIGISLDMLKYYVNTYTEHEGDPFPPQDVNGTRDVEEVRAWVRRREAAAGGRRRSGKTQ